MNSQKVTRIGQKVKVVANTTNHQFEIGQIVQLKTLGVMPDGGRLFTDSCDDWLMFDSDYEILPDPPTAAMIGHKPFDLQKSLAGEPVVTRDGRPVKIAGYNPDAGKTCQICGWVNGDAKYWCADGLCVPRQTHYLDLFMATKTVKKEGWVNIYAGTNIAGFYSTKQECDEKQWPNRSACIRIEWEEEV